jgi:dodecin
VVIELIHVLEGWSQTNAASATPVPPFVRKSVNGRPAIPGEAAALQPRRLPHVAVDVITRRETEMNHIAKVIEVVGTSDSSLEDAIRGAIARAAKTVDNLQWFEVKEVRGALDGGNIERFQVMLKIGFGLNDE